VVDLTTGVVRKLPVRSTPAYFNPGCGTGEEAVLTQETADDEPGDAPARTRLFRVDGAPAPARPDHAGRPDHQRTADQGVDHGRPGQVADPDRGGRHEFLAGLHELLLLRRDHRWAPP
jgi:hypothetical protein